MSDYSVKLHVRHYELDTLGHINSAVYYQYAEHARWECMRSLGIEIETFQEAKVSPVLLSQRMHFKRELRPGDDVEVSCTFSFPSENSPTFLASQRFTFPDGTLAAKLESECGVLDLEQRTLVRRARPALASLADDPAVVEALPCGEDRRYGHKRLAPPPPKRDNA